MENNEQPQVKLSDTTEIKCSCGHENFQVGFSLRHVSAIVSPKGVEEIVPVQIFFCAKCKKRWEPPLIVPA